MNIEDLRKQVDMLDDRLVELFLKRTELVKAIGTLKKEQGLAVEDAVRENAILERLTEKYGEDNRAHLTALFKALFDYCKNLQK